MTLGYHPEPLWWYRLIKKAILPFRLSVLLDRD